MRVARSWSPPSYGMAPPKKNMVLNHAVVILHHLSRIHAPSILENTCTYIRHIQHRQKEKKQNIPVAHFLHFPVNNSGGVVDGEGESGVVGEQELGESARTTETLDPEKNKTKQTENGA